MRKPKLGPDGLPIGWDNRSYDYAEMCDLEDMTALKYGGDAEFPEAWMDTPMGGFCFTDKRNGRHTISLPNPNHAEDQLFRDIATLVSQGRSAASIVTYVRFWMSVIGFRDSEAAARAVEMEIHDVRTFAARREEAKEKGELP